MTQRAKPFFSSAVTKQWDHYMATGVQKVHQSLFGKPARFSGKNQPMYKGNYSVPMSHPTNHQSKIGARVTGYWVPENAKKKNMRPKHEIFNSTHKDGIALQGTKRLAHVTIPNKVGTPADVQFARYTSETLHDLQHTPLLHQQWDPERHEPHPFSKTDPNGRPIPPPPLPDFPRFYNREVFSELDAWQASTNDVRYNKNTECYLYFHFWAHDDKWVHKRRIDVWDYVKNISREYIREKLATTQRILYGEQQGDEHIENMRATGENDVVITRLGNSKVTDRNSGFCSVRVPLRVRNADPLKGAINSGVLRYKFDGTWNEVPVAKDGLCIVTVRMLETEVENADLEFAFRSTASDDTHNTIKLSVVPQTNAALPAPPADLLKALPGFSMDEAAKLYQQELLVFEEELINTLYNLDAIMHPTPILYACQNELAVMAVNERISTRQGKKDFDWWFHHQSFSLYLPFHDEEMLHAINNWRSAVNQKVGNSPWIDSLRQHSPQPVNCLLQVFKKHNNVWDERVFKVENDVEAEFQEEHAQEWSFVEHAKEPQPTQPMHVRAKHPAPIDTKNAAQLLHENEEAARDEIWAQMPSNNHKVLHEGQAASYAEEYFRDTFAARRATNQPVHPADQPGIEVDEVCETPPATESERPKYIRRLGKLYRKYYNPYNAMPQRFAPEKDAASDLVSSRW
eukprot:TRINITY_DN20770_c0_g1_i1.p1 TRINITY_DN20770_c0_g1~~TRINITY_DN20770_c0_g1_i1.p1  ORF type:complete len:685 (+),score=184.95 TRINITY_DN20770_c0_g1_i1:62-2116(+)